MSAPLEIERVWLLRRMPTIPAALREAAATWEVEQGYLPPADSPTDGATDDETDGSGATIAEGRLRAIRTPDGAARFVHTIKRGLGRVREEIEHEIDQATFDRAWPRTAGRRIRKTRLRVPVDGRTIEVDVFHDLPVELVLAEIEFDRADEAIDLPPWLAAEVVREVTEEPAFRNFELARRALESGWLAALVGRTGGEG